MRSSLKFRFSQPWQFNGKDAIFVEFTFSGGKADGNRAWGDTDPAFEYKLDSMPEAQWRGGAAKQSYPDDKKSGCVDSYFGTKFVPATLDAKVSGTSTVRLDVYASYTAPNAPLLLALGVAGREKGVRVTSSCNLFYPDLTSSLAILVLPTPTKFTSSASISAPRQAAWQNFWMQAAWFDSKSNALKLSNAIRIAATASGIVPFATSYVAGGTRFNVWTSLSKGLPYVRYDL